MFRKHSIAMLSMLLVIAATAFATGSPESAEPSSRDTVTVRYLVPGNEPVDSPLIDERISEEMQASGLNLTLDREYIGWDVWDQKTNIMMVSGEPFEILHVMENRIATPVYVGRGALQPITDLLADHGPILLDKIPQNVWDGMKISGELYGVPVHFRDFSAWETLSVNQDLFEKHNLPLPPADWDELIESLKTIQANESEMYYYTPKVIPTMRSSIFAELDSYPFTVVDMLFVVSQEGEVRPWLETEEFKFEADLRRRLYVEGITLPDILTVPSEVVSQMVDSGLQFFSDSDMSPQANTAGFTAYQFTFAPEKPAFRARKHPVNSNAASATTDRPETLVQFFNWVYSSQENHDLLNRGIEGVHWRDEGPGRYSPINNPNTNSPDYVFGDWEMGLFDYVRLPVGSSEALEKFFLEWNEDAIDSVAAGFTFDPTPVNAEYANVLAEMEASVYPIRFGVVPYETHFEAAMQAMERAGYDEVVEEFTRQFAAWYALQ